MAEQLDLTVPVNVDAGVANWKVFSLLLNKRESVIKVGVEGDNSDDLYFTWQGTEADDLMIALNKANLSTTSLQKRILDQAVTDGKLTGGTVSGTPDA